MRNVILIICLTLGFNSFAVDDWKWGNQEAKAKSYWSTMEQLMVEKNYASAHRQCSWLLTNAPELNEALYQYATKVYDAIIDKEASNSARLTGLQDTALMIYDRRIEFFGNEAENLNRKGKIAYKYLRNRPGSLPALDDLYSKIFEMKGNAISTVNLTNYMRTAVLEYQQSIITKNDVLSLYLKIQDVLEVQYDKKEAASKSVNTIDKNKNVIDETFSKYVKLTCEDAHVAFEQKFKDAPSVKLANKIYVIMSSGTCSNDELYEEVLVYLSENDPKLSYTETLAMNYYNSKLYDKSYTYYSTSLDLTTDSLKKSDLYYNMASIRAIQGKKSSARVDAMNSLTFNSNAVNNHRLIGDLYMASYDDCKSANVAKSRAVFVAAYNEYNKAGYSSGMSQAKAQFPSSEEIFMSNMVEGTSVPVGCWIGGTVKLVKR